jgi:L-threonylcarbamoyladenylate synthase
MDEAIKRAKGALLSGGLVAYPTESFYGLAVDAINEEAIRRLFTAKKRKPDHPVLIVIPSVESFAQYAIQIPLIAHKLTHEFWPGGLTLVFEASSKVSSLLTAGAGKIGIRLSSHPVATALTRSIGAPITGTSANISGEPPCRTAQEVLQSLGEKADLILDGGKTEGKIGSTVLDVTVDPPQILREGLVPRRQLEKLMQVKEDAAPYGAKTV